jgi:hypothetical protein
MLGIKENDRASAFYFGHHPISLINAINYLDLHVFVYFCQKVRKEKGAHAYNLINFKSLISDAIKENVGLNRVLAGNDLTLAPTVLIQKKTNKKVVLVNQNTYQLRIIASKST